MKAACALPVILLCMLQACNRPSTGTLSTANLASSFIAIDAAREYVRKTPRGATIKIAANSFEVPAGAKVFIEIKEAYSMQEILLAGLTTRSNEQQLQSAGMIYFNATVNSKTAAFLKPVKIDIPSAAYDKRMQLFTGVVAEADSSINWVQPSTLDSSKLPAYYAVGEALFNANCLACHHPYRDKTGPMPAGARDRAPYKEWPYKFIDNVNSMLVEDPYAIALFRKWGSKMTQFNLPARDIKAILDYCDNEARIQAPDIFNGEPTAAAADVNIDCGYDTIYTNNEIAIQDSVIADNIDTSYTAALYAERPSYSFSIDQSGWYNIDMFMNEYSDAVTTVELSAVVNHADDKILDVYLCIPQRKLLAEGNRSGDDLTFTFGTDSATVNLIKGDDAIVYVLGKKEDKYYHGFARFMVSDKQQLSIELQESDKETILKALKMNKIGNSAIDPQQKTMVDIIPLNESEGAAWSTDSLQKERQVYKRDCPADSATRYTGNH